MTQRLHELYELCSPLGRGTFATVRRAKARVEGTEVALKIACSCNLQTISKLKEEYEFLGRVSSPHIIKAVDLFCEGFNAVIVLEYFASVTLQMAVSQAHKSLSE